MIAKSGLGTLERLNLMRARSATFQKGVTSVENSNHELPLWSFATFADRDSIRQYSVIWKPYMEVQISPISDTHAVRTTVLGKQHIGHRGKLRAYSTSWAVRHV